MDLVHVNVPLPTAMADASQVYLFRAPSDALGGGCTVLRAAVVEDQSGQTSGTAWAAALHKYSSAGTPAVNGTISTAAVGGTASPLAAGVPQEFSLDSDYVFLDAGEWLVMQYDEEGGATNPTQASIEVLLQIGK